MGGRHYRISPWEIQPLIPKEGNFHLVYIRESTICHFCGNDGATTWLRDSCGLSCRRHVHLIKQTLLARTGALKKKGGPTLELWTIDGSQSIEHKTNSQSLKCIEQVSFSQKYMQQFSNLTAILLNIKWMNKVGWTIIMAKWKYSTIEKIFSSTITNWTIISSLLSWEIIVFQFHSHLDSGVSWSGEWFGHRP